MPTGSHLPQTLIAIAVMIVVVALLSLPYYLTQFENFYPQVLAEAHGMIFDMFLIGVLMFWMESAKEKRTKIAYYTEELDDIITIGTPESALRVLILIKRLNRLKVFDLKLTGLKLINGNLNKCNLRGGNLIMTTLVNLNASHGDFSNAFLSNSNWERCTCNETLFNGCYSQGANYSHGFFIGSSFKNSFLVGSNFEGAYLMKANFEGAVMINVNLKGASLTGAKLRNVSGLTLEMLLSAKTIDGAELDEPLVELIAERNRSIAVVPV